MILYHGSYQEIAKPDLIHSRPNVDFGRGFYVTPLYEQAAKWCSKFKRRGNDGIVSCYEFDEKEERDLQVLKFDSYSEEWLDFFYRSKVYLMMRDGVSDMHCMSDAYLAEDLKEEYEQRERQVWYKW